MNFFKNLFTHRSDQPKDAINPADSQPTIEGVRSSLNEDGEVASINSSTKRANLLTLLSDVLASSHDAAATEVQREVIADLVYVCGRCGKRYVPGVDAILVSMKLASNLLDGEIRLVEGAPQGNMASDMIAPASMVPGERREAAMAQTHEAVHSAASSLQGGGARCWICYQCKAMNHYSKEAYRPERQESEARDRRVDINRDLAFVGVAYLFADAFPGICKNLEGIQRAVATIVMHARTECGEVYEPPGWALHEVLIETKAWITRCGSGGVLEEIHHLLSRAEAGAIMVGCMLWIAETMLCCGMGVASNGLQDDPDIMRRFFDARDAVVARTVRHGERLGFTRVELKACLAHAQGPSVGFLGEAFPPL